MKLTDRKKEILKEVISRFIGSPEPVSSQNIAENAGLKLSPATIRKEMAELEEMGYLAHPHTSAGRVPSDMGYRYFVDNFIKDKIKAGPGIGEVLPEIYIDVDKDMEIENILKKSSEELARITKYLSMIVAPAIYQSKFRHIELLELSKKNLLLVLITDTGRVSKRNFLIEGTYNNLDFQSVANMLNLQLRDRNIMDLDFSMLKINENDSYLVPFIKKIIDIIKNCAHEAFLYNRVFVYGASSIICHPDFIDLKKIHRILGIIENEYMLADILLNFSREEEFIIKIGAEIFSEGPDDLGLVASRYNIYKHSQGMIGVLGPKRMDYYKVANIVNAFVNNLKKLFN